MSPDNPYRDDLGGLEPARPVARPDRRRRGLLDRHDEPSVAAEDLDRGRSAALLGALGRLQLRVDVMAKQQEQVLERLVSAVEALEARVARLDGPPAADRPAPGPPPARTPPPGPGAPPWSAGTDAGPGRPADPEGTGGPQPTA